MKKYVALVAACAFLTAGAALALGLPGGGGKVDTKKIDEVIASLNDLSTKFAVAKAKVDDCQKTLNDVAIAHGIADILSDPSKISTVASALTAEEKALLQAKAQALTTVPTDITAITQAIPDILTNKIPAALADIVTQIQKNPLSAGDLKNKQDQLNAGKAALDQIIKDAPALVTSAQNLSTALSGIL